jgi:hypothetical protein
VLEDMSTDTFFFFFVLGVDQNDIVLNQNTIKTLFI